MGWASCLEDICSRYDDDGHRSSAMVGPVGTRPTRTSREPGAAFTQLEHLLETIG